MKNWNELWAEEVPDREELSAREKFSEVEELQLLPGQKYFI